MHKPFELLKLLRDSKVIPSEILHPLQSDTESLRIRNALIRLLRCGLLHQEGDRLHLDSSVTSLFHALELSMTALAPYTEGTVLTTPTFMPPKNPSPASVLFVAMPFSEELQPVYEDHILSVEKK